MRVERSTRIFNLRSSAKIMEAIRSELASDLSGSEQIFCEFFKSSNVGLAVFDRELRYRALNQCLAGYHKVSPKAHLGKVIREILGPITAPQVEPVIQQVFATALPILNYEVVGPLPTRPRGAYWMGNAFPFCDSNGNTEFVGAVVVELKNPIFAAQPQNLPPLQTILRSWKDIARYLGACVKTVQRWEHAQGLPVHRVMPNKSAVVFASKDEIDAWLRTLDRNSAKMSVINRGRCPP